MTKLPHENVYARLKPSKIHGVGVFAIIDIPKGTYVFSDDNEAIIWIEKKVTERLSQPLKELYNDFAIVTAEKYGCPISFNRLSLSWYLNHAEEPNMTADPEFCFFATRDIKAGEELTVNYRTYSEDP